MKNGRLRSVLVIFQFAVSIVLIVGTLIMFRQVNFLLDRNLGFDKEQLLVIARAGAVENHVDAFKEDIKKIKGVISVASSTAVPGHSNNNNGYMLKDRQGETILMQTNWVDPDFFETYKMTISSGKVLLKMIQCNIFLWMMILTSCMLRNSKVRTSPFCLLCLQ
jgi:putative ABC transport system permease protein